MINNSVQNNEEEEVNEPERNIIEKESYDILITAHQLNDLFEWFLMQLSKGSGLVELLGMQAFEKKEKYTIFRPLLSVTKEELEDFLKQNSIKYFIDSSNTDEKYKRNYFRKKFSNQFLSEFTNGVKNSFAYLNNDLKSFISILIYYCSYVVSYL